MNRSTWVLGLVAAILAGASLPAAAAPVQWPDNGHWYELVVSDTSLTWYEAKAAAEAGGGYLVTVTSQAETDFIVSALGAQEIQLAWMGGYQDRDDPAYSEPGGGWKWVTGEPWAYTNWEPASGEPNNAGGNEDWTDFHGDAPSVPGSWCDVPHDALNHYKYVTEYIPEPGCLLLLVGGVGCLARARRRRRR